MSEEQREPTDIELSIRKHTTRLANIKHIDAKDLALNYVFPMLSRLAKETGDHENFLADLADDVQNLADESGGGDLEILEGAREVILKLASLLDETMVAAGFYTVAKTGLQQTEKIPADLKQKYEAIGPEVVQVTTDIQQAIEVFEEDEEDEVVDVLPAEVIAAVASETPTEGAANAA